MFAPNTAFQLKGIYPALETVDGETRKRVKLEFFCQPFTAVMARDLDILGNLFARVDAAPFDDLVKIELAIAVPLQQMTLRSTADSDARLFIENVRVDKTIKIRRDKEGPVLAATFGLDFPYPTADDLLYLFGAYTNQLYVTLAAQQGNLLTEEAATKEEKPRRRRKDTTAPATDDAQPEPEPAAV